MDPGERITGTRDEHYNLISVLYHALQGAETIEAYTMDAEAAGDERLATFFREAQAAQIEIAERAKGLLGIGGGDAILGAAPLETGIPPETPPVDVGGRAAPEAGLSPESQALPDAEPVEDVAPSSSVDVQREPSDIPADEFDATAEEALPTTEILRTSSTVPLPDQDLLAETIGVMPEDLQEETPPPEDAPRRGATEPSPAREISDEPK